MAAIDGPTVTPERLLRAIREGDAATVVDVRSALEYRRGQVPGAVHLPFWSSLWWKCDGRGSGEGTRASADDRRRQ